MDYHLHMERTKSARVDEGWTAASLAFDGVGRRRGKTNGWMATNFLYDAASFVQELSFWWNAERNPLTAMESTKFFDGLTASARGIPLVVALGSTLALTDGSGVVQT